ncbi:hydrogenase-1 expression HyaE [Sedimenticola hydrogenitrophicus]|uniref:hydrogenase-1 expression HyaE n=1 Tax=Sedimenticola hydrogenitrophicus TaxID=2967975 RepID=UPI0021A4ABD2|nr:hydrogenase-1 expression HyaE [Sedimenticola hydrogenitrophicus]
MPSTLIRQMIQQQAYPELDEATLVPFLAQQEHTVLFFTGDPKQYPESNDVAVILPELAARFAGRFRVAVVAREAELPLQKRFPFSSWPALVFLRGEHFLGAITRVQNWGEYLTEIERLLGAEPLHLRGVGIPVVAAVAGRA